MKIRGREAAFCTSIAKTDKPLNIYIKFGRSMYFSRPLLLI